MTKDKALKLALDLAIMHHSDDGYAELRSKVRQLAKEALAPTSTQCEVQPKQEPVAGDVHTEHCFQGEYKHCCKYGDGDDCTAAPKRPWVGLTDDERANCWRLSAKQSAINIEAKLKEKNT